MKPEAQPDIARVAALIGDTARAHMLFALLDGRELPASELAFRSGSSPQAASAHLHKLVRGNLLVARSSGRQRLFKLASPDVATAIETLAAIAPRAQVVSLNQHTTMQRLRQARSCYDHLAGRLGVAVTHALLERKALALHNATFTLTPRGARFFTEIGIDVDRARSARREFARACLDWTEREPHLAGSLGAALLDRALHERWVEKNSNDRALRVTPNGCAGLAKRFGIAWP